MPGEQGVQINQGAPQDRRYTGPAQSISAAPFGDDKLAGAGGGYMDHTEHHGIRHRPGAVPSIVDYQKYQEFNRRGSYPFAVAAVEHPWDPEAIRRVAITTGPPQSATHLLSASIASRSRPFFSDSST